MQQFYLILNAEFSWQFSWRKSVRNVCRKLISNMGSKHACRKRVFNMGSKQLSEISFHHLRFLVRTFRYTCSGIRRNGRVHDIYSEYDDQHGTDRHQNLHFKLF